MTNTSRNSATKQPHKKKNDHQHHAAHADVIYLRIMSIAIFTLLYIKTKHNLHNFKNHEHMASGIPYKTQANAETQIQNKHRNSEQNQDIYQEIPSKMKSISVQCDVKHYII
jgi:uncharacterized protein YegP (UPF0339 family)